MLIAAPASAGTICEYGVSYNNPEIEGACFVDAVPGCPIHLVDPHSSAATVMPVVYRSGAPLTVTATTEVVGTVTPSYTTFDYYSCACTRRTASVTFDELAVTIPGLQPGDEIYFDSATITVGAAGACPAPAWPIEADFQISTGGCDPCPMQPPPRGCAASGGDSGWIAAVGLALLGLRRRKGQH